MDNFTILVTLIIILAVYAVFTAVISRNTLILGRLEWRLSALFLFTGFLLILSQKRLTPLISICLANFLLILGFYFQTSIALIMKYDRRVMKPVFLLTVSLMYWVLFIYFTYIQYSTSMRIVVISLFLVLFYANAAIRLFGHAETRELFYLFSFASLFYTARSLTTLMGSGAVSSLIDPNLITTSSFIFLIIFNMIFMTGLFSAFLRSRNNLLQLEKEKLSSLFGFLNDTARHLKLDDLYKSIEKILKDSINIETAAIYLIDHDRESHTIAYVYNKLNIPLDSVTTLRKGQGISGRAMEEDRVIKLKVEDYPIRKMAAILESKGVSELLSIPLKTSEGIIGAITVVYTDEGKSHLVDEQFVYYLGEQIALVLHNAFLFEKLALTANTDPLTGLFNRRRMMEILKKEYARTRRGGVPFTLIMADLDFFKQVNDNYGHDCGDEVLRRTAGLFRRECRESDSICRWGGEEFLLLLTDSDAPSTLGVAERIREYVEDLAIPCTGDKGITVSMGVAAYDESLSLEQIIAAADETLYVAKKNGRNRVESR